MTICKIHQIYYSQESYEALDAGFIPLDNSEGRSDWMEYWPIRQYFLNNAVRENDLVGFFSPRFFEKTGLSSADVYAHIESNPGQDVYLFNPYFDLAAWYPDVFTQAGQAHPNIKDIFNKILNLLKIEINVDETITSSMDTVFCNYFVANLDFWKSWLIICEFIFQLSEEKSHPISVALNENTDYVRRKLPMKIFIIERVASFLLSTMRKWRVNSKYIYHNMDLTNNSTTTVSIEELHKLDALKIAYIITKNELYISTHNFEKKIIVKKSQPFI